MVDINFKSAYAHVNGLQLYYEIYGQGKQLVLIHGGGSTILTSFGKIIPLLAKNRKIIAVELQAHGRTNDRESFLSFEQDADDVATLLNFLKIPKADFLGYSNGGHTAIEIAIRHSALVNKIVLCSTFYKRSAAAPQFWEGFDDATLDDMPGILKEEYLRVNNSQEGLQNMFNKDVQRMKTFKDWSDQQIQSIKAPTLVMNGNMDVGSPEHAVEMYRLIPDCEMAILPGRHGSYLGAIESLHDGRWTQSYTVELIEEFLDK
jgi:pimeloyl-ACP methyl ester carboxylesterase